MPEFRLPDNIALLAKTVWLLAGTERVDAQAALAWLIRNRSAVAARHLTDHGRDHPRFGDGSLPAACRSVLDEDGAEAFSRHGEWALVMRQSFSRTLANVWLVWNGCTPDPTGGATRFHRHDQSPCWSARCVPLALIGERIYYADEVEGVLENSNSPEFPAITNEI